MKLVLLIINLFDFFHKRKIINFLKIKIKLDRINLFLDVGAHHGETIDLFSKNFSIKKLISFEASPKSFKKLFSRKDFFKKRYKCTNIILENVALGSENKKVKIKEFVESSSSTIQDIDQNSKYYKKKFRFLNFIGTKKVFEETEIDITKFKDYLEIKKINNIDFLKIDTEGYEFEVLIGAKDVLSKISIVLFEHHYDDMITKNYKFSDIHNLLLTNHFTQLYKSKMPFRKTFEYIYVNKSKK
jgi:FkbM family methyltransferase